MHVLGILTEIYHFVLNYTFDKVRNDPGHFASLLVVFGETLRLLEVFQGKCFDKLQRNSTGLDESSNHIDHVEADV